MIPVNKITAISISKSRGLQLEFKTSGGLSSMVPLPNKRYNGPKHRNLTGLTLGRMTVIGVALIQNWSKIVKLKWVVRCSCGRYEQRKANTLKKGLPQMCAQCKRTTQLKDKVIYELPLTT